MFSRHLTTLILAAVLTGCATGRHLPTHAAPVPAGASQELQEIIRNASRGTTSKPPATYAEWKSKIEQVDASDTAKFVAILSQADVSIDRDKLAGIDVHRITPLEVAVENETRLFLYIHGGAYVFGSGDAGLGEAVLIADRIGIPVLSVDYRMPPDHPFPAPIDDVVAVYLRLLDCRSPESIIVGGTSSGGGLTLAAVHQFQRLGIPLPGAIYAGSPWADLTKTGDTLYTHEGLDRILTTYDGTLGAAARLYVGDHSMTDALVSPVYGDFQGFPPTFLVTGTRDMFLSDTARTHRKLREAGAIADLLVFEGMSHAGYWISPKTPESRDMYRQLKAFIDSHLH